MKKILFDLLSAQPVGNLKFHGGGEYIKSIFAKLIDENERKSEIVVFFNKKLFLDDWILNIITNENIKNIDIKSFREVTEILSKDRYDVFYTGLCINYEKVMLPNNVKKIGTIHGLRDLEKYSDRYSSLYSDSILYKVKCYIKFIFNESLSEKYKCTYQNIFNKFDTIICVSDFTKYSIISNLSVDLNKKIYVFYTPLKNKQKCNEEKICDNNYILLIGGNRWIKNTYRAIKAIDYLFTKRKMSNMKVIIVGKISNSIMKKIHNKDEFIIMDFVPTEELEKLYRECSFFVYPSLNEGFGMPPLEAMAYGKTCIVSAVSSLPEICGNAVYYVNPYDLKELRNKIMQAYNEKIDIEILSKFNNKMDKRRNEDLKKVVDTILNN